MFQHNYIVKIFQTTSRVPQPQEAQSYCGLPSIRLFAALPLPPYIRPCQSPWSASHGLLYKLYLLHVVFFILLCIILDYFVSLLIVLPTTKDYPAGRSIACATQLRCVDLNINTQMRQVCTIKGGTVIWDNMGLSENQGSTQICQLITVFFWAYRICRQTISNDGKPIDIDWQFQRV